MANARRFGGVKAAPVKAGPSRRFGAVKAVFGPGAHNRQCVACRGRVMDGGTWIHDVRCPYMVVLWKRHGYGLADWWCEHGCPGYDAGTFITHRRTCAFWTTLDREILDALYQRGFMGEQHGAGEANGGS